MTNAYSITNAFFPVNTWVDTWVDTNSGDGSATASMITINPMVGFAAIMGLVVIIALTVWFMWPNKTK